MVEVVTEDVAEVVVVLDENVVVDDDAVVTDEVVWIELELVESGADVVEVEAAEDEDEDETVSAGLYKSES